MKKKLAYVLMIVFAISAFTGCKGKKTDNPENIAGDNEISSDNNSSDNNSTDDDAQDPTDEIEDNEDDSEDVVEENKENDSGDDSEDAAKENKKNSSKDASEDAAEENKENDSKDTSKGATGENKKNGSKDASEDAAEENKKNGSKDASKGAAEENKKNSSKDASKGAAGENEKNDSKDASKDAAGDNKENGSKDDIKDTENGNTQDTADHGLSSMIKEIYKVKNPGLMVADIPVDLSNSDSVKYYTGLSDASKIKEAVASEAMIGSQAYSLVLVQLNDEKDAETVADEMLKGIDTRKWICVEADDLRVVGHDDVIMLFMVSSALKENVTSKQMVDAFKEVCDGELDIELKK